MALHHLRTGPALRASLLLLGVGMALVLPSTLSGCSSSDNSGSDEGSGSGSDSGSSRGSSGNGAAQSGQSSTGANSGASTGSSGSSVSSGSSFGAPTSSFGGGYYASGTWHGYAWTSTSGAGSTISPTDFGAVTAGQPLCASGSVAGLSDYSASASVGVNLNQAQGANTTVGSVTPGLDGVTVNVTNRGTSPLRIQIQGPSGAADANDRWCYVLSGSGGFIPWSSFNTECWGSGGKAFDGKSPIVSASIVVPGAASGTTPFDFCLNELAETTSSGAGGGSGSSSGSSSGTGPVDAGVLGGSGALTTPYQWAAVTRDGRNYIVQNNVWGGTSNQAVRYDGSTFTVTQQNGSNPTNGAPVSYPSVFIGSNNGRSTAGDDLPKAVTSLRTVPTTWTNNAGTPPGTYNAAYDVWFSTNSAGDPGSPTGGFLMVWYHKPPMAQPIGSVKYSAVTIPGATGTWDVWMGMNGSVPCISYVSTEGLTAMSFDLNKFIQDAVQNRPNTIQSGWYLTNIYAGFEIWTGGAGLETTSFSAIVN